MDKKELKIQIRLCLLRYKNNKDFDLVMAENYMQRLITSAQDKNPKHCTYKQKCINQNCLDGFPCEYHEDFIDKTNK